MKCQQQGLTLIELLLSVALSLGMALILIQLHIQSSQVSDQQQLIARQLENTASLQHLLSHGVRDALYSTGVAGHSDGSDSASTRLIFDKRCMGIKTGEQCIAPVQSWTAGDSGAPHITSALHGSVVLQLKQDCCAGVVADQFYLARRGSLQSNPISLYRRRLKADGSYTTAVELVEGVEQLSISFVIHDHLTGGLALVSGMQVTHWWTVKAVRIRGRLSVVSVPRQAGDVAATTTDFTMTVAGRQWQQVSDGV